MREVTVGKKYKHFKNKLYEVIAIAYDCEDLKKKVIYKALYDEGKVWVRDYESFLSKVDKEKYPDVIEEWRFTEVDE